MNTAIKPKTEDILKKYVKDIEPQAKKLTVLGLEFLLNSFKTENLIETLSLSEIAYILATSHIETFNYKSGIRHQPIEELGSPSYFLKYEKGNLAKILGNLIAGDGLKFKGRGFVQITGRKNYTKFTKILNIDLISNPEKALEPKIAFQIATYGMIRGTFTGKKLKDYFNESLQDFYNARKIINGLDRAKEIEKLSYQYLEILK